MVTKKATAQTKNRGQGKPPAKAAKATKAAKPSKVAKAPRTAKVGGGARPAKGVKPLKGAKAVKGAGKKPVVVSFKLDSRVILRKDVAWRMIEGEAVIVTPDYIFHTLNEVGTRIWLLLDGKRSIREVAHHLESEFEVDGSRVQADTLWFVECLAKKGLVEPT